MNLLSERLRWAIAEEAARQGVETIRPADLARAAKTSQTSVGYWLSDVNGIGAAKARLLADYLHVDALWLETGRGSPERGQAAAAAPTSDAGSLNLQAETARELQLLLVYRAANERERKEIDAVVENMRLLVEGRTRNQAKRTG
jgi:transcriptional regulator with XRE-family HTH domain